MASAHSSRIVMVNSEMTQLTACEVILKSYYKDVTFVPYQNVVEAWWDISGKDPDLLITAAAYP